MSTARGWLRPLASEVVSIDVRDLETIQLEREVMLLRRRVAKFRALSRLSVVVVQV